MSKLFFVARAPSTEGGGPLVPQGRSTAQAVHELFERAAALEPTGEELSWLEGIGEFRGPYDKNMYPRDGLLLLWGRALQSYGTPLEFVATPGSIGGSVAVHGEEYPSTIVSSKGYELRRHLMTAQLPYEPQRREEDYPSKLLLGPDGCLLCGNLAQGYDRGDNVLVELQEFFLLPNRYPGTPLHSLLVLKGHDDMTNRVTEGVSEGGTFRLPRVFGKTRGNLLSEDQLREAFEVADYLGAVVLRNHVLDGMSIPAHDHLHLSLEEAFGPGHIDRFFKGLSRDQGAPLVREISSLSYSVLAVRGGTPADTAAMTKQIIERLERANVVFTLLYARGEALISPRDPVATEDELRLSMGCAPNLAFFHPTMPGVAEMANRYLPRRGEFGWERYLV